MLVCENPRALGTFDPLQPREFADKHLFGFMDQAGELPVGDSPFVTGSTDVFPASLLICMRADSSASSMVGEPAVNFAGLLPGEFSADSMARLFRIAFWNVPISERLP